jgi:hypothetical protein
MENILDDVPRGSKEAAVVDVKSGPNDAPTPCLVMRQYGKRVTARIWERAVLPNREKCQAFGSASPPSENGGISVIVTFP